MKTTWNLPTMQLMPLGEIEEGRAVLVVTSSPAWEAVEGRLHLKAARRVEVKEATLAHWDSLLEGMPGGTEAVYAVGGGLAADAGKYMASRLDLPLTCLPTALSVDAFLTAAAGIRREGCVRYIETKPPEKLILDMEVLGGAPENIRAAGITDVMSIATGCWDWKFAEERGQNPEGMRFIGWVHDNAQSILEGALDCAQAAGRGDGEGLKTLYDCLAMEVQLCNQIGHARPEEGSEHYFAYCAENFTGGGLPHGDLVGAGIMIMARRQGQETGRYEAALRTCHVPFEGLSAEIVRQTLQELPSYCRKHDLPFGIAHTMEEEP